MKMLKVTYMGNTRHVRSVPLTGEVETVAETRDQHEKFVVIDGVHDAQRAVDAFAYDHRHDPKFELVGSEVVGDVYGIYRGFQRMLR